MTLIQRKDKHGKKSDTWSAVEPIDGKRKWWNTGTANKRTAKARAKVYFDGLRQGKFDEIADLVKRKAKVLTIGEFLDLYEKLCVKKNAWDSGIGHPTWIRYLSSLRLIVGNGLLGNAFPAMKKKDRERFFRRQPLTVLTDGLIINHVKVMRSRINGTEDLVSHKRTVYSQLRCAQSFFSPKTYQILGSDPHNITLPDLSAFKKYQVERGAAVRYKAPEDDSLEPRTNAAARQLKLDDPEAYKMYRLAHDAGLRKSEISAARISWLGDHKITVQSSGDYLTKSGHDRLIPLTTEVYQELLELTEGLNEDDYLLVGGKSDRERHTPGRLNEWLAALGWTSELTGSNKKLHALRANYISTICQIAGIHAAQHLAGHADYSTTDRHYADPNVKVTREG